MSASSDRGWRGTLRRALWWTIRPSSTPISRELFQNQHQPTTTNRDVQDTHLTDVTISLAGSAGDPVTAPNSPRQNQTRGHHRYAVLRVEIADPAGAAPWMAPSRLGVMRPRRRMRRF